MVYNTSMKIIRNILSSLLINATAIWIAQYFVSGFYVELDIISFIKIVTLFTLINILLKPLAKMMFGPITILTLGLGIIIVNALMLYLLILIFPGIIAIAGLYALIYATIIIGAVNFILHLFF